MKSLPYFEKKRQFCDHVPGSLQIIIYIQKNTKMIYSKEDIAAKIKKELEAVHVEVEDFSDDCGMKFGVIVVSEKFQGKPLLQRHRLVNTALAEEMEHVHALTQKTYTPTQWNDMQQKQ